MWGDYHHLGAKQTSVIPESNSFHPGKKRGRRERRCWSNSQSLSGLQSVAQTQYRRVTTRDWQTRWCEHYVCAACPTTTFALQVFMFFPPSSSSLPWRCCEDWGKRLFIFKRLFQKSEGFRADEMTASLTEDTAAEMEVAYFMGLNLACVVKWCASIFILYANQNRRADNYTCRNTVT